MPNRETGLWTHHWPTPVTLFGIIELSTGKMFPQELLHGGGYTSRWYKPEDPKLHHPRLFPTLKGARQALQRWAQGEWEPRVRTSAFSFQLGDQSTGPSRAPLRDPTRKIEAFAVIRVNLNVGRIEEFGRAKLK